MTERFMVFLADGDTVKCEVVPSSAYDRLKKRVSDLETERRNLRVALTERMSNALDALNDDDYNGAALILYEGVRKGGGGVR